MATVTIKFIDSDDGGNVAIAVTADPMPNEGDDLTPAQELALIVHTFLDRMKEVAEEDAEDAAA